MKKIRVEIEEEVKDKVCIGCRFLFDDYVARAKCLLFNKPVYYIGKRGDARKRCKECIQAEVKDGNQN